MLGWLGWFISLPTDLRVRRFYGYNETHHHQRSLKLVGDQQIEGQRLGLLVMGKELELYSETRYPDAVHTFL